MVLEDVWVCNNPDDDWFGKNLASDTATGLVHRILFYSFEFAGVLDNGRNSSVIYDGDYTHVQYGGSITRVDTTLSIDRVCHPNWGKKCQVNHAKSRALSSCSPDLWCKDWSVEFKELGDTCMIASFCNCLHIQGLPDRAEEFQELQEDRIAQRIAEGKRAYIRDHRDFAKEVQKFRAVELRHAKNRFGEDQDDPPVSFFRNYVHRGVYLVTLEKTDGSLHDVCIDSR